MVMIIANTKVIKINLFFLKFAMLYAPIPKIGINPTITQTILFCFEISVLFKRCINTMIATRNQVVVMIPNITGKSFTRLNMFLF
jgi:hypothetical protein